jgi:hypothetical protein
MSTGRSLPGGWRVPAACIIAGLLSIVVSGAQAGSDRADPEALPFAPRAYVAYRVAGGIGTDGRLTEPAWSAAPWTEVFIDIEGAIRPVPRFRTRAKMLWDDEHFYVAAEMEEPDLWATLTERDAVIFQDNDFEVFIDPDGDTHAYYELEVNALGTPWDLMLIKPYRDGGPAIDGWDIAGLRLGIDLRGTINQPRDRDDGWTIEIAMPWKVLREAAPGRRSPAAGDRWRVNFSRVQWQTDVVDGRYVKRVAPGSGKPLPENNWVWSPQGAVDMHMPERWGYVQFSGRTAGAEAEAFTTDPDEAVTWELRRLYYRQRRYFSTHHRYAATPAALAEVGTPFAPLPNGLVIQATRGLYEITAPGSGGSVVHINQEGRTWITR